MKTITIQERVFKALFERTLMYLTAKSTRGHIPSENDTVKLDTVIYHLHTLKHDIEEQ